MDTNGIPQHDDEEAQLLQTMTPWSNELLEDFTKSDLWCGGPTETSATQIKVAKALLAHRTEAETEKAQ
ncbi:MAG: hypothetical protein FWE38_03770 [Firmicutes bacterium]|nr:hypothetical protein [Bacillota bacterium]